MKWCTFLHATTPESKYYKMHRVHVSIEMKLYRIALNGVQVGHNNG